MISKQAKALGHFKAIIDKFNSMHKIIQYNPKGDIHIELKSPCASNLLRFKIKTTGETTMCSGSDVDELVLPTGFPACVIFECDRLNQTLERLRDIICTAKSELHGIVAERERIWRHTYKSEVEDV